ncbi:Uncharacterized protein TCM_000507 [Theobroma cacao]|uniref:Uncharacterized protein n=1 Tax=Theobroma cacao TaxID=3641 RepID=A0A061DG50_THECC|nr:Uncharacterized protein TCM_000507 [Theobroma cacao]
MDFMIPKAQPYSFSGAAHKVMNVNNPEEKETETTNPVTSQLQIKSSARSSPEALDKEVVLRRLRHHKCKNKAKSAFQALVGSSAQAQEKWMELGDAFTCP